MRNFSKRTVVAAAASTAVLAVAGVAYAYYAASVAGSGTGTATPAANTSAAVTFAASTISGLVPGGSAVSTTVTPHNPNPYSVHILARTVSVSTASGGNCSNAEAQLSGTATMVEQTILANSDGTPFSLAVSMADDPSLDQTDCAGTSLTVTYAAS